MAKRGRDAHAPDDQEQVPLRFGALGYPEGRDAIYLDRIEQTAREATLTGELNGSLCGGKRNMWIPFSMVFRGVQHCCVTAADVSGHSYLASFVEVRSSRLARSVGRVEAHTHWVVAAYDHVCEVVAEEVLVELGQPRA